MIHQQFYELQMFQVIFPDFWVVFRPTYLMRKGFDINKMAELNDDLSFLDVRDQKQIIKISKKNQQLWAQLKQCYNQQKQSGQQQLYLQQMYAQQYTTGEYNSGCYQNYGNQPYYNAQKYPQQNYARNVQMYAGSQASTVEDYSQMNKNSAQVNGNINKVQKIEQVEDNFPVFQVKKREGKKIEPPASGKLKKKRFTIQEIRKLIYASNPEQLKTSVTAKLLEQIQETKKWKKTVKIVPAVSPSWQTRHLLAK